MPVVPLLIAMLFSVVTGGRALRAEPVIGLPIVTAFSSADVGNDAQTFMAAQDPSGVLFFGGNTLLRFDAERWTSIPLAGAYGIRGLDVGPDGKLWVGAMGEFGWYANPTGKEPRFTSLRAHLPADAAPLDQVWRAFAEDDGAIFVTADRVMRWRAGRLDVWPMPGDRRLLAMRVNGTVYIDHSRDGVYAMRSSGPQLWLPRSILRDAAVSWMDPRRDGWLLATNRGLFLYRDQQISPFAPAVSDILMQGALTGAARLRDGRYAFGTLRAGIVIMEADGRINARLSDDILPTRAINSLLVDRDGDLWATSASAVFRVDGNTNTTIFDDRLGLPPQAYRSIARQGDRIMIASERGAYAWAPEPHSFTLSSEIQENVFDLRVIRGQVVATGFGWLKQLDAHGRTQTSYRTQADVFTASPARGSSGALYIAEGRRIALLAADGTTRTIVVDLPQIARSIAEDEAGNLWLATIGHGVLFAVPRAERAVAASPVPESYGLPPLQGRTFHRMAADGGMLVFADNGGWYKPAGETRFVAIERYPSRPVTAVSEIDSDGTAWIACPATDRLASSVARIALHARAAEWAPHSVSGLPKIGLPRSLLTETGENRETVLWIGGTQSVLRHVVRGGPVASAPRPPVLQVFAYRAENDTPQVITGPLSYSTQRVSFVFAATEFARRSSLRLETRIRGIDPDWQPAASDGGRELSALRDGQYVFEVRTIAETGVPSAPTTFAFQVLPPIWRTPGFITGVAVGLLPLGYGVYLLRIRNLRRRTIALEAKVRERTEELVEANAAKTQFVANISHDIRNPLNGIVGLALALEDTPLDDRQTELVSTLRECTTYLSSLVDDVLDFASIEAGKVELRPQRFAPVELLRSITETMKADTFASGATLEIVAAADVPPHLEGDTGRIQQILVNFVSNALKYAGGHITLSVALPAGAPGEVEFAVTDRGPGIATEEQAKLFTKFTRLRPAHGNERIPGTGLGLAACRLLADIMGGSVGIESASGAGACFFLRLPLTVATAEVPAATRELPNASVLLVEDTDYNAWAAKAVLAKLGLTCERARTGVEAIALFQSKRFNVVLLDRNLPDMDGTEVARRIRELEADSLPAVLLAVTAYCTEEDRTRCLAAGMDAFVGKPVTPEKLRKALLAAGRRQLTAATMQASVVAADTPLDLEMLTYLSDGSPAGLQEQIKRFLAILHEAAESLRSAAANGNHGGIARAAHAIRGQARMVGDHRLADTAANLESAAQAGDEAGCAAGLAEVAGAIAALTAAMRHRPTARSA